MSLEQLFLQLGICGAMLLVWFRLESRRQELAAKADERRIAAEAKAEEQRTYAENRRTEAMEEGFRQLANMVATHAQNDTRAHGVMAERLAAVESTLGIRKQTPPQGVQVAREVNRARTQGGDR
jgi:hypothetical protein